MVNTISPDVARAAVSLRRSHPQAPALEVLDVVMRQRTGSLQDFGDAIRPGSDFGAIIAAAFDQGMAPTDWNLVNHPNSDPALVAALTQVWDTYVLPRFAAHYGLGA